MSCVWVNTCFDCAAHTVDGGEVGIHVAWWPGTQGVLLLSVVITQFIVRESACIWCMVHIGRERKEREKRERGEEGRKGGKGGGGGGRKKGRKGKLMRQWSTWSPALNRSLSNCTNKIIFGEKKTLRFELGSSEPRSDALTNWATEALAWSSLYGEYWSTLCCYQQTR